MLKYNQLARASKVTVGKYLLIIIILLIPEVWVTDMLYDNVLRLGSISILGLKIEKSVFAALSVVGFSTLIGLILYRPVGNYLQSHYQQEKVLGLDWKKLFALVLGLILVIMLLSGFINSQYTQAKYEAAQNSGGSLSSLTQMAAGILLCLLGFTLMLCSGVLSAILSNYVTVLNLKSSIKRLEKDIEKAKERSQELAKRIDDSLVLKKQIIDDLEKEKKLLTLKEVPMDFNDFLNNYDLDDED